MIETGSSFLIFRLSGMKKMKVQLLTLTILLSGLALECMAESEIVDDNTDSYKGDAPLTLKIKNEGWYVLKFEFNRDICTHNEIGNNDKISGSLLMGRSTSYPIYASDSEGLQCIVTVCPTPCYESYQRHYKIKKSTTIRCGGNVFSFNCDLY